MNDIENKYRARQTSLFGEFIQLEYNLVRANANVMDTPVRRRIDINCKGVEDNIRVVKNTNIDTW